MKNSLSESVEFGELIIIESTDGEDVDDVAGEKIVAKSKPQDVKDDRDDDDEDEENKDALSGEDGFELTEVSDATSINELAMDSIPASTLDVRCNKPVDLFDAGDAKLVAPVVTTFVAAVSIAVALCDIWTVGDIKFHP